MKSVFCIVFIFLLSLCVSAQQNKPVKPNKPKPANPAQIKSDAAKKLETVNADITEGEKILADEEKILAELRRRYTDDFPKVQESLAKIITIKRVLNNLYELKKDLQRQQMYQELPNNQVELLKMLIVQNDQIIDLLKNLQPKK